MTLDVVFWILMLLWLVFGAWPVFRGPAAPNWPLIGGTLLQFILFALLGWKVFGPAIHG